MNYYDLYWGTYMSPTKPLLGIHHITALASDPQRNLDFYVKTLGLHLVKQTVNYDEPGTYHFYFGDQTGSPGTILTFFPFPDATPGKPGRGQITAVMYAIAPESISFWVNRLSVLGVAFDGPFARFSEVVIAFHDPDGMCIELVADNSYKLRDGFDSKFVPAEHTLRGFLGVTLASLRLPSTQKLLADVMEFTKVSDTSDRLRLSIGADANRAVVDLDLREDLPVGISSAGSVHHIAWRVADDDSELTWREKIRLEGLNVTPVIDRNYFHSIYFREPGGVLYEIATDPPGFGVDESIDQLGHKLQLPPWMEPDRERIARRLPPITLPKS